MEERGDDDDIGLGVTDALTQEELLERRVSRLRRLCAIYKKQMWRLYKELHDERRKRDEGAGKRTRGGAGAGAAVGRGSGDAGGIDSMKQKSSKKVESEMEEEEEEEEEARKRRRTARTDKKAAGASGGGVGGGGTAAAASARRRQKKRKSKASGGSGVDADGEDDGDDEFEEGGDDDDDDDDKEKGDGKIEDGKDKDSSKERKEDQSLPQKDPDAKTDNADAEARCHDEGEDVAMHDEDGEKDAAMDTRVDGNDAAVFSPGILSLGTGMVSDGDGDMPNYSDFEAEVLRGGTDAETLQRLIEGFEQTPLAEPTSPTTNASEGQEKQKGGNTTNPKHGQQQQQQNKKKREEEKEGKKQQQEQDDEKRETLPGDLLAEAAEMLHLERFARSASIRNADRQYAVASLLGRHVTFLITSQTVLIGRATPQQHVQANCLDSQQQCRHIDVQKEKIDIDLTSADPVKVSKVSRRQAYIYLRHDGRFIIENVGRRKIYVNGDEHVLEAGMKATLKHHDMLAVGGIRFIFEVNPKRIAYMIQNAPASQFTRRNAKL